MIRLMQVSELEEVLKLVSSDDVEALREVLPHLNVYVYDVNGIQGFTYIVEGYFIGDVISINDNSDVFKALVGHLQERYEELLIHLELGSDTYASILKELGFKEDDIDLELADSYQAYLYLS